MAKPSKSKFVIDAHGRECSKCGTYKSWFHFPTDNSNRTRHTTACSDCRSASYRRWAADNKEHIKTYRDERKDKFREISRRYMQRVRLAKGKAAVNAEAADWRNNNEGHLKEYRAKYYAVNRDKLLEKTRKDRRNRPHAYAAYDAKKRAKRKKSICSWADQSKIAAMYRTAKILRDMSGAEFHVDHIVPLVSPFVTGLHVHDNLRIITARDNLAKNNVFNPMAMDDDLPAVGWADLQRAASEETRDKVEALVARAMALQNHDIQPTTM